MRIVVGQGSCGIAAGASKIYFRHEDILKGQTSVLLEVTGCVCM